LRKTNTVIARLDSLSISTINRCLWTQQHRSGSKDDDGGKKPSAKTSKSKRTEVEEPLKAPSEQQKHGDAEDESHMEGTYKIGYANIATSIF
jgi:hypothetical protein